MTPQRWLRLVIVTTLIVLTGSASQAANRGPIANVAPIGTAVLGFTMATSSGAPGQPGPAGSQATPNPKTSSSSYSSQHAKTANPQPPWLAWVVGGAALVLFYLLAGWAGRNADKSWNPLQVCIGTDGRLSSSKFQFFLWTIVALFTYAATYTARFAAGLALSDTKTPTNLLLAMGLSVTTMATAKAITASYVANGKINKNIISARVQPGDLFRDDSGSPDITKIQMMSWTLVAIAVYLSQAFPQINNPSSASFTLPDIDTALMVLMGLGQGAFITTKAVTTDTPHITSASLSPRGAARILTLNGTSLGATQGQSQLTLDGIAVPTAGATWSDTAITLPFPTQSPATKAAWPADGSPVAVVQVGVTVGGQDSNRVSVNV